MRNRIGAALAAAARGLAGGPAGAQGGASFEGLGIGAEDVGSRASDASADGATEGFVAFLPEPGAGALGAAALATLTTCARRRRAPIRARRRRAPIRARRRRAPIRRSA